MLCCEAACGIFASQRASGIMDAGERVQRLLHPVFVARTPKETSYACHVLRCREP